MNILIADFLSYYFPVQIYLWGREIYLKIS